MEENTEVSLEESEPLAYLRHGMMFSFAAWILMSAYFVLNVRATLELRRASPSNPLWGALFVACLPCWGFGLFMRRRAWIQLGRGETASALATGGIAILFSPFVLSLLILSYFIHFGSALYILLPLILYAVWGCYTFLEGQAMKSLTDDYGIGMKNSRICSFAGIVVWAAAYVCTFLLPIFMNVVQLRFWYYYGWSFWSAFPVWAYLISAPLFMASCASAILALGRRKS